MSKIPFHLSSPYIPQHDQPIDVHILEDVRPIFTFRPQGGRRFDLVQVKLGGHNVITTPFDSGLPCCNYVPMIDAMIAETDPHAKELQEARAKVEAAKEALAAARMEVIRLEKP